MREESQWVSRAKNMKRDVAVRVEIENSTGRTEMYRLARPTKKPWKTSRRCVAAGVPCAKDTNLLEVQYYEYKDTDGRNGNITYILENGLASEYILLLVCIVHNVGDICFDSVSHNAI